MDEIHVPEARLLRESAGQLRLEQPPPRQQGLAQPHAGQACLLERRVETLVGDPALLHQDRPQHGADLFLEVAVIETKGRGRARGDPQAPTDELLVRRIHLHTFQVSHRLSRVPGRSPNGLTG